MSDRVGLISVDLFPCLVADPLARCWFNGLCVDVIAGDDRQGWVACCLHGEPKVEVFTGDVRFEMSGDSRAEILRAKADEGWLG